MKSTAIAIVIAGALIGGAILYSGSSSLSVPEPVSADNVTMVDGTQQVTITAKGGYSPRASVAKAGVPTTLRIQTQGTFDCSSALAIPALQYRTNLPPSGITEIAVPPQQAGTRLQGICAMGMYSFVVAFE